MSIFNLRRRRNLALALGTLTAGAATAVGCLNPPVVEQQPNTSNVFVQQIVNTSITAIDLLFVIDNSVSMGDKQAILENAVPQMVERLLVPDCVNLDEQGVEIGREPSSLGTPCSTGFEPEFSPVRDIHIGVISSSLGSHGAASCMEAQQNDRAILIPGVRSFLPDGVTPVTQTADNFLTWQPEGAGTNAEKDELKSAFANHVVAAGESGCGFEAPLEAWYRFLVDANPPEAMEVLPVGEDLVLPTIDGSGSTFTVKSNQSFARARDEQVLTQRKLFLRQDSLVAIVVLTDENDCSAMDGGLYYGNSRFGYLLGDISSTSAAPFSIASEECAVNPNAPCCYSCLLGESNIPEECRGAGYASSCPTAEEKAAGLYPERISSRLGVNPDEPNARCVKNKQRFGLDLLYPTQRYVDGLTKIDVFDQQTGVEVPNPLLAGFPDKLAADGVNFEDQIRRPDGLVFFAGIVGIPWQDLATEDTLTTVDTLEFLTSEALLTPQEVNGEAGKTRWDIILGTSNLATDSATCRNALQDDGTYNNASCGSAPVLPLDPFMIESFEPRAGTNPITGDQIVTAVGDPTATINGHEFSNVVDGEPKNDDLQYACTFPLQTPKDCTDAGGGCDCDATGIAKNSPLCEPTGGGAATSTQTYAKAYPATRILQVLKDFGGNSIVGSICPKISSSDFSPTAPGFGYNPAVKAIVDRLKEKLGGTCLPRELTIDEVTGEVPCTVVEAKVNGDGNPSDPEEYLSCLSTGRSEVSDQIRTAVEKQLEDNSLCGGSAIDCSAWTMCEVKQLVFEKDSAGNAVKGSEGDNCFFQEDSFYAEVDEAGYCYIDPAKGPPAGGEGPDCSVSNSDACNNPNVLQCPASGRRQLRFVGPRVKNAVTFVACVGESAGGGLDPSVSGSNGSAGSAGAAE
jgi:hypothetical protein